MENEVLQKYLEKLIHLQEHSSERFTEDNFRIAIDSLGLSEKEKVELNKEFDEQLKLGSNYYRSHNYTKAIERLEVAQHIEPFNLSVLMLIVDSYKQLYLETYQRKYYDKIVELCNRGLQLQSLNAYFAKVETFTEKCEQARKVRATQNLLTGSMVTILLAGLFSLFFMKWLAFNVLAMLASVLVAAFFAFSFSAGRRFRKLHRRLKDTTITLKFVSKGK